MVITYQKDLPSWMRPTIVRVTSKRNGRSIRTRYGVNVGDQQVILKNKKDILEAEKILQQQKEFNEKQRQLQEAQRKEAQRRAKENVMRQTLSGRYLYETSGQKRQEAKNQIRQLKDELNKIKKQKVADPEFVKQLREKFIDSQIDVNSMQRFVNANKKSVVKAYSSLKSFENHVYDYLKRKEAYAKKVSEKLYGVGSYTPALLTKKTLFSKDTLRRAWRGTVNMGKELGTLPQSALFGIEKAVIIGRGLVANNRDTRKELFSALKKTPSQTKTAGVSLVKSLDPRKPENWANIFITLGGLSVATKSFKIVGRTLNPYFIPPVKNAETMLRLGKEAIVNLRKASIVAKRVLNNKNLSKARAGFQSRKLKAIDKSIKSIQKINAKLNKFVKDPKRFPIEDFNPLIKETEALKLLNKEFNLFHSTGVKAKNMFGNTVKTLKTEQELLKSLSSSLSKKPAIPFTLKSLDRQLLKLFKKEADIIVGGARAQNVFVKKFFRRKTSDWDLISSNPNKTADLIVKYLKQTFKGKQVNYKKEVINLGGGKKGYVYKVFFKKKHIIDISPAKYSKGLTTKTVGGVKFLDPKTLLKKKYSTLGDLTKAFRHAKDKADIKRLVGALFDRPLINKRVNPKNVLEVVASPGKGQISNLRLSAGETHFFFDIRYASGYAINEIARNIVPKTILNLLKKTTKLKDTSVTRFIFEPIYKKLNSLKYVRANDRLLSIQGKFKINDLPKSLLAKIKKSSGRDKLSLRKQISDYINSHPNKIFVGGRTRALRGGEREVVAGVGSKLFRRLSSKPKQLVSQKLKSFDPDTGLTIDITKTAFNVNKVGKLPNYVKQFLKVYGKTPFKELRRRLMLKKDVSKWRSINRALQRASALSDPAYVDLREFIRRLIKSRKANLGFNKRKTSRRVSPKSRVRVKGRVPKPRLVPRPKPRTSPRPKPRTSPRPKPRPSPRPKPRPRPGPKPRPRPRPKPRPRPRPKPRPRPGPKPRPSPRPKPRPRPGPKLTPPVFTRKIPVLIPKVIKQTTSAKKKLEWIKKKPAKYRPSLIAILFNIRGKMPKTISGFEIRPILDLRKK